MGDGGWTNDAVTTLTVPTGATTGERVVINGVSGDIEIYDAFNKLVGKWNAQEIAISADLGDVNAFKLSMSPSTAKYVVRPGGNGLGQTFDDGEGIIGSTVYDGTPAHTQGVLELVSPLTRNPSGNMQPAELDLFSRSDDGTTHPSEIRLNADMATSTGPLYSRISVVETWHAAVLINGFSNRGVGFPNLSYRLVPSPANSVQLVGQIVSGATVTNGTVVTNVPAGYQPTTEMSTVVYNTTSSTAMGFTVLPNGQAKLFGSWVNGNIIQVNIVYPLDL